MKLGLENKVVIISGCTGGLGATMVHQFLEEGAIVIGLYRNEKKLWEIHSKLNGNKERFFGVRMAFGEVESMNKAIQSVVKNHGRIDVLVNNAGKTKELNFLMHEDEEIDEIMDINFTGHVKLTKAVLPTMFRQKSGAIVNITSTVAHHYGRGVSIYASAKAALARFTETLSMEVGKKGIRVNTVAPGLTDTPMGQGLIERLGGSMKGYSSLGKIATTEEIVPAVLFLASNSTAGHITGQHLLVDGGSNFK